MVTNLPQEHLAFLPASSSLTESFLWHDAQEKVIMTAPCSDGLSVLAVRVIQDQPEDDVSSINSNIHRLDLLIKQLPSGREETRLRTDDRVQLAGDLLRAQRRMCNCATAASACRY